MKMKNCGVFVLVCGLLAPITFRGGNETNDNGTSLHLKLCPHNSSSSCKMPSHKSGLFVACDSLFI
jgi:hypothetical protein